MNSYADDVSWARRAARDSRKWCSIVSTCGCVPPKVRRALGSISSSALTASRSSSSVAPGSIALRERGGAGYFTPAAAVADYSGAVASLFDNMRAPAALIGGSLVPLGMLGAPPASKDDKPLVRALKKAYLVTAIAAISGEITTVIYSTIVINKLAETSVAPASSVVALIARDYQLEWLGARPGVDDCSRATPSTRSPRRPTCAFSVASSAS